MKKAAKKKVKIFSQYVVLPEYPNITVPPHAVKIEKIAVNIMYG
jgi:hypothetical protein